MHKRWKSNISDLRQGMLHLSKETRLSIQPISINTIVSTLVDEHFHVPLQTTVVYGKCRLHLASRMYLRFPRYLTPLNKNNNKISVMMIGLPLHCQMFWQSFSAYKTAETLLISNFLETRFFNEGRFQFIVIIQVIDQIFFLKMRHS
jgi:hypothetical protein